MYAPQGLPAVYFSVLASSVIIVAARSGLLPPCVAPPLGLCLHIPEFLTDALFFRRFLLGLFLALDLPLPCGQVAVVLLHNLCDLVIHLKCIPDDWGDGYENVVVCCTVENQINADYKLQVFSRLPIKHKCITAQPLLEGIDIEKYLDDIELVVVGGESDRNARPLDYSWVLNIREQCIRKNVSFEFRQCGTHFIKGSKEYKLQTKDLCSQARKAGIDFQAAYEQT